MLIEHESILWGGGGSASEQKGEAGQSPQEQPREVSPQEYEEIFMSSIPDDSGTFDLKLME